VTGYEQDGEFHPRVCTTVTPQSAALARPRPNGQDLPSDHRYHRPADLHDGLAVGDIALQTLESRQQMPSCTPSSTAHIRMFTASSSTSADTW
jgi:hypothetical protein